MIANVRATLLRSFRESLACGAEGGLDREGAPGCSVLGEHSMRERCDGPSRCEAGQRHTDRVGPRDVVTLGDGVDGRELFRRAEADQCGWAPGTGMPSTGSWRPVAGSVE